MSYIYVPITFVFQPGGVATGNIFTSWALLAARLKVTAGPKIVQIDDSFAAASVPVGVWDMSDTTVEAFTIKIGTPTALTLPDNAVLKDLAGISTGLNLVAQGVTQPSFQITSPGAVFVDRAATIDNQGTQPIVRLGATDILAFEFQQGTFNDTAGPLMDLSLAGATGAVGLFVNSQAGNNTIVGVLGTLFEFIFDAGAEPLPTNPGFSGTTTSTFVDQAFAVGYTPTTAADWSPVPDNVGTALDELAARGAINSGTFLAGALNVFGGGPNFGVRPVNFSGCGGGGAGGGGSGASLAGAPGVGGGGGGAAMYGEFTLLVDFTHRIDFVFPGADPLPGTAGGAPGADGGNGQDGGTCYVLDFTTNTILCAFPGGSGGQGGANLGTPGLGGANFPSGQLAGNLTTGSSGFVAAGGNGGSSNAPITPGSGNQNLTTFGLTPPGPAPNLYGAGAAGANGAAGQGGGGGGGGQGPFGPGGAGGNGNAGTGTNGGDVNVGNFGSGAGGGAGGAIGSGGSRGGIGGIGRITYEYTP